MQTRSAAGKAAKEDRPATVRITARLAATTRAKALFWAERDRDETGAALTFNDFVALAVENEIARRAGALVDIDHIIANRLEQLADAVTSMGTEVGTLNKVVSAGYGSIIELARGDSGVLADSEDDGELDGFGGR